MRWDNAFDSLAMDTVVRLRSAWVTDFARAVMWVGTTPVVLATVVLLALITVVVLRAWRPSIAAGIALVLAAVVAEGLKAVFERPRPPAELALVVTGGFSFPSTQATETAALVTAVILTPSWGRRAMPRPFVVLLIGATALVGACMIYLGAHWPTDVLAGWLLGALIGSGVSRAGLIASRVAKLRSRTLT